MLETKSIEVCLASKEFKAYLEEDTYPQPQGLGIASTQRQTMVQNNRFF